MEEFGGTNGGEALGSERGPARQRARHRLAPPLPITGQATKRSADRGQRLDRHSAMACFTMTSMRAALPSVAFTTRRPQPRTVQLPSYSGMKLAKGLPLQAGEGG